MYLLSPLMGFLSRAWSLLRGPGPPELWPVEAGRGAAEPHFLQFQNPQDEADNSRALQEGGEAAGSSLGLEASSSAPEACRLSCDPCGECRADVAARLQPGEFVCGQPESLCPGLLLSALQGPDKSPRDQQAGEEGETKSAYLSSHYQGGPAREEQGEAVNKESAAASASPLAPGLKPSAWLCFPKEKEERATEDRETENTEARESPVSSPWSSASPGAWQSCLGEAAEEGTEAKEVGERGDADPEPWSSVSCLGLLLSPSEDQPREDAEEEETANCDSILAEEEVEAGDSSTPLTDTFLGTWVYQPGEDTEEEEEDDDDRDLGSAEEGEAVASPATLGTSTFLRAWVYRPGEDTEEEDEWEENQDTGSESVVAEGKEADWSPSTSLQLQGVQPRAWTAPSGGGVKEEHPAEAGAGAETRPLAVAIYVPGQKPPAPWVAPKLPLRLQRRLKLSETLPQEQDPEAPTKDRKVRFSEKVTVHLLAVWSGPAQAARRGPWEQLARDRSRFARRIAQAEEKLGPCLTPAWRARAWARLGNPPGLTTPVPCPCQGPSLGSALDQSHGHTLSLSFQSVAVDQ